MIVHGIEYTKPEVFLLQESGIGSAEIAARTCYDSFDNSENTEISYFNDVINQGIDTMDDMATFCESREDVNKIESSELLDSLAWVHHHHSIIEHTTLSYLIKGTSRGVLQEHSRHRLQAISVRSTRYTMGSVINAFLASVLLDKKSKPTAKGEFNKFLRELDMFVISDPKYLRMETDAIYDKLMYQKSILGDEDFLNICLSKEGRDKYNKPSLIERSSYVNSVFIGLQNSKKKRNVGDAFKHIVSTNWKVDMVVTFNLRSLKNYFDLRNSGAAWFQIQWLAEEMINVTPEKYLKLILKNYKK